MRPVLTALSSALVGGVVGYQIHNPISSPACPANPDIDRIAQSLRKQGFTEIKKVNSWWFHFHHQYMYSRSAHAQAQCSFQDPKTGVTESYYSIPDRLLTNMDLVYPTIFDEGLANVAFRKLPNRIGVTGTLEIGPFKASEKPKFTSSILSTTTPPDTEEHHILVLRADPAEAKGRKSSCKGKLTWYGSTKPLATGKVIMIEPWWGKYFSYLL